MISYALDAENAKLTHNGECVLHVGAGTATPPNPQPSLVSSALTIFLSSIFLGMASAFLSDSESESDPVGAVWFRPASHRVQPDGTLRLRCE